jgi:hypothetical protein
MNKHFPLKIELPGIATPSQNEIARWLQYEYYRILQMKGDCWNMLLLCNADDEKYMAKPGEKRIVHFYSYRSRKIDPGNLVGGMKYLVDSLQNMGLIWRDSEKYLEAKYYQYKDKENPRTEIIIYLIEED